MRSHVWLKYDHGGETIEITIRDFSGKRLESWKVSGSDRKAQRKIFKTIKAKYNINLFFKPIQLDKDLQWLD